MTRIFSYRVAATWAILLLVPAANTLAQTIDIQNTRGLAFGGFVAESGGSVTIGVDGARSAGGSVMLLPSADGHAAEFTVTGSAGSTYTIDLPADGSVVLTGPGADMVVSNFTSSPSGAGGQLSSAGSQTVTVGGTLNVGANQASGDYSGSFTVNVSYN